MIYEHLYAKCNSSDGKSSIWATAGHSPEISENLVRQLERMCHFEIDPSAREPQHEVRFLPLTSDWFSLTFITTMPNGNAIDSRPSAVFHTYLFGTEDAMALLADENAVRRLFYLPHITNFPAGAKFEASSYGPSELMVRAVLPAALPTPPSPEAEATLQDLFLQAVVCDSQTQMQGLLIVADNGNFAQHADTILRCLTKLPVSLRIFCGFHTGCRSTSELPGLRMVCCSEQTLLQFRETRFDGAPASQWMLYAPGLGLVHSDGNSRVANAAKRICACHTAEDFAIIDRLLNGDAWPDGPSFALYIQAFMQWQNGGMPDNTLSKAPADLPLDWLAERCKTTGEVCVLFLYALEAGTPAGKKLADACAAKLGEEALPVLLEECTNSQQKQKILSYFHPGEVLAPNPAVEKIKKALQTISVCLGACGAVLLLLVVLFAIQWHSANLSFLKTVGEVIKLLLVIAAAGSIGFLLNLRMRYRKRLSRQQNSQD